MTSQFASKIISGQKTDIEDWNQFLIEVHNSAPSMTPAAFASYRTKDDRTSYELLAKNVDRLRNTECTVLDLACGDGYLFQFLLRILGPDATVIGVDMCEGELAVARSHYSQDKHVKLLQARAQSMPLAPASIDAVVCHMAFMLMLPLDSVVSEIKRVLKSGGTFSAVVGNAKEREGFFLELLNFTFQFVESRYPKILETRMGDPRVQSEAGIQELFDTKQGFSDAIDFSDIVLQVSTDAQGVWDFMRDMYFVSVLPPKDQEQLQGELKKFVAPKADAHGNIAFEFQMRMFTVKKL